MSSSTTKSAPCEGAIALGNTERASTSLFGAARELADFSRRIQAQEVDKEGLQRQCAELRFALQRKRDEQQATCFERNRLANEAQQLREQLTRDRASGLLSNNDHEILRQEHQQLQQQHDLLQESAAEPASLKIRTEQLEKELKQEREDFQQQNQERGQHDALCQSLQQVIHAQGKTIARLEGEEKRRVEEVGRAVKSSEEAQKSVANRIQEMEQRLKKEQGRSEWIAHLHEQDEKCFAETRDALKHVIDLQRDELLRLREELKKNDKGHKLKLAEMSKAQQDALDEARRSQVEGREFVAELEKELLFKEGALSDALCRLEIESEEHQKAIQRQEDDRKQTIADIKRQAERNVKALRQASQATASRLKQKASKLQDAFTRMKRECRDSMDRDMQLPRPDEADDVAHLADAVVQPRKSMFRRHSTLEKASLSAAIESASDDSSGVVRSQQQKRLKSKRDRRQKALRKLKKRRSATSLTPGQRQSPNSSFAPLYSRDGSRSYNSVESETDSSIDTYVTDCSVSSTYSLPQMSFKRRRTKTS